MRAGQRLDAALTRLVERGDVTGKAKELVPLYDVRGIAARTK